MTSQNPDELPPTVTLPGQLSKLLASLGSDDAASVRGVFGAWNDLVGEAVAAHVQPVKLDHATLHC
ncbi:MAG: DciA family protein [Actinomycetota bacterium]